MKCPQQANPGAEWGPVVTEGWGRGETAKGLGVSKTGWRRLLTDTHEEPLKRTLYMSESWGTWSLSQRSRQPQKSL